MENETSIEIPAPDSIPSGSFGAVILFFPDEIPPQDISWAHPNGTPAMDEIPLYHPGESKPFSTLRFILKHYETQGDLLATIASFSGECYAVEASDGTILAPYEFEQGERAARNALFNIALEKTENMWEKTHYHSVPLYRVSFRLKGNWDKKWLYIILNDSTKQGAYIKCDSLRMQPIAWEAYLNKPEISFRGHNLYDKPNGNPIVSKRPIDYGRRLSEPEEEWVQVSFYNNEKNGAAWLRWRDDDGIFPNIYGVFPIY